MLGRAGHRVEAFERFSEIYRLPRAVHIDHEIMRLLQAVGVADRLADELVPLREYRWFGADGEELMTLTPETPSKSGWEPTTCSFSRSSSGRSTQRARPASPSIAAGWRRAWSRGRAARRSPCVATSWARRAWSRLRRRERCTARWVIGADGANSFVREAGGIDRRDLGFQERWLVVDVEPSDMSALAELPVACQWCDPRRPTTHVQSGPRHRRWEFMLLPGRAVRGLSTKMRAWSLLEPWFTPADGTLTRAAVYEFRSMLADRMRDGNVVLAGDAAHLTPPFLGQGLCAGLRDAANVAWKLDLVLRGLAPDALLDTVAAERQPQNEWVIGFAIELGKDLCQLDPARRRQRDATLREAGPPPPIEMRAAQRRGDPSRRGRCRRSPGGSAERPGAVEVDGRQGRFDDVVGRGWTLSPPRATHSTSSTRGSASWLTLSVSTVASLDPGSPAGVRDLDGRLTAWLGRARRPRRAGPARLLRLRQRGLGRRAAAALGRPAEPGWR